MAGLIHVLDSETIDKIAAGEVVEKPASVVKELVENAIDAGADKITVEIKEGGISFIRITDNGCGIAKEDLTNAFMRHATSKIENADDLNRIASLGFRGEALSSISAVAQVEMITKTKDNLMGIKVCCNGGTMDDPEEIGAPDGTTIIVRNLFYNTPVRKKFLKTPMTEGSYIAELMQHIAMSHPNISISFIQNGQTRFFTSGNGDLSEIIYRIYGKDVSDNILAVDAKKDGIHMTGFIGKPILARANRNYETFFVNGRYIKSKVISSAIEEGYKTYLMQHKYPFAVLHFEIAGEDIDVNVHPTKMEIRIMNPQPFCEFVKDTVIECLSKPVLIPEYVAEEKKTEEKPIAKELPPEPFETQRHEQKTASMEPLQYHKLPVVTSYVAEEAPRGFRVLGNPEPKSKNVHKSHDNIIKQEDAVISKVAQMELFNDSLKTPDEERLSGLEIIGQVFKTYWLVEFEQTLYFVDQHAAHEKVNYERLMKKIATKENTTQMLMPPMVISLSARENAVLERYEEYFMALGFEIEEFGGDEITLRGIPQDLYGVDAKEMFLSILDELVESPVKGTPDLITSKIASMSCKAAVKGNQNLSYTEAKELLKQLFALDNPYHCPHGRPTMFSMSKYEMEKKFKRIL